MRVRTLIRCAVVAAASLPTTPARGDVIGSFEVLPGGPFVVQFGNGRPSQLARNYVLTDSQPGSLSVYDDGRLHFQTHLTPRVGRGKSDVTLDMWFSFRGTGATGQGAFGPILGPRGLYPADPATWTDAWEYFDIVANQSTMAFDARGRREQVQLESLGWLPFQLGTGANALHAEYGMWGLFLYEFGGRRYIGELQTEAAVTANPVPAPGAALLGLIGLGCLAPLRRRWAQIVHAQ